MEVIPICLLIDIKVKDQNKVSLSIFFCSTTIYFHGSTLFTIIPPFLILLSFIYLYQFFFCQFNSNPEWSWHKCQDHLGISLIFGRSLVSLLGPNQHFQPNECCFNADSSWPTIMIGLDCILWTDKVSLWLYNFWGMSTWYSFILSFLLFTNSWYFLINPSFPSICCNILFQMSFSRFTFDDYFIVYIYLIWNSGDKSKINIKCHFVSVLLWYDMDEVMFHHVKNANLISSILWVSLSTWIHILYTFSIAFSHYCTKCVFSEDCRLITAR